MAVAIKPKGNFWSNFDFNNILNDIQNISNIGAQVVGNYNEVRNQFGNTNNQGNQGNQGNNSGNIDIPQYQNEGAVMPQNQASFIPGLPNEVAYIGVGILSLIALKKYEVI